MATQSQRRAEALAAIRRLRQEYRKADSAGERFERELDRLTKRKTLIGPDQIQGLAQKLEAYARLVESAQRLYVVIANIIANIPR